MKLSILIMIILSLNLTAQKNCYPYSKLNSDEYNQLFPILAKDFRNSSIMVSLNSFNNTKTKGEGGNGIVKILTIRSKTGKEVPLAIKKLEVEADEMFILEDEIKYQLLVQESIYVPKFYGCFGDPNNKVNSKVKVYYIVQQALNFDLAQDKYVYFNGKPIKNDKLITDNLSLQKRLKFYTHLFKALIDFKSANMIHNDIKPQNIMVGSKGYNSYPQFIDFGIADSLQEHPSRSTICYEFKGKYFVKYNTIKFDVYSLGATVIDLEYTFERFCGVISNHQYYKNVYDTWSITEKQILFFEERVTRVLQVPDMNPRVQRVQNCDTLNCILLFTVQRYLHRIPEPEDIVEALEKLMSISIDENKDNKFIL